MINNIDYHIIDKCNLNCANCNHFSPLVPSSDNGKSIEQITADLALLSKIKDGFETLSILGGEPTLHPQLSKILKIARDFLPNNTIHLVTNGTLYNDFGCWKAALAENKIDVFISLYPYCENSVERTLKINETLKPEVNVFVEQTAIGTGFSYGFLSNRDNVATDNDISMCNRPYLCSQLKNGKLYICNFAAQFDRLKNYFGDKITFDLDGNEYFDLNGEITLDDLNSFINFARPSICYHCTDCIEQHGMGRIKPWGTTKKDINEWIVE